MDVGKALRDARQRRGMTLRDLARRAGTSHSALAAYESRTKVPRADTMIRVLEAAGWEVLITSAEELGWEERVDRSWVLEQLLDLADQFPTRRGEPLRPVRFGWVA